MKPFHYNQDPIYAAAATILSGHTSDQETLAESSNEYTSVMDEDQNFVSKGVSFFNIINQGYILRPILLSLKLV